jgi:pimeloyl-ACP methyl ester carboxylesterase
MPAENLLLLPGMMCDERMWASQIDAINLPTHVGDLTTSDDMFELAHNILADAPASFALAGLSMGGIVAFEIWRQAPERVTHLALIDTNPYPESPARRSMRVQQISDVLDGRLRELATESLKPVYLAEAHRDNQELLDTILDMALDFGPDVFRNQSVALMGRPDSLATLPTISCPTTVICGAEDTLCPPAYHETMADHVPGAKLVVLDNCGHLASMEQPDAVTAELEKLIL